MRIVGVADAAWDDWCRTGGMRGEVGGVSEGGVRRGRKGGRRSGVGEGEEVRGDRAE